jgi:hypothetical protein
VVKSNSMILLAATFLVVGLGLGLTAGFVLRRPVKVSKVPPSFPRLPIPVDWTSEDCAHLARFLKSPAGQNLLEKARCMANANAATACAEPMNIAHSGGVAHGINEFITWMLSLGSDEMFSRLAGAQAKKTNAAEGTNDAQSAEIYSFT